MRVLCDTNGAMALPSMSFSIFLATSNARMLHDLPLLVAVPRLLKSCVPWTKDRSALPSSGTVLHSSDASVIGSILLTRSLPGLKSSARPLLPTSSPFLGLWQGVNNPSMQGVPGLRIHSYMQMHTVYKTIFDKVAANPPWESSWVIETPTYQQFKVHIVVIDNTTAAVR